MANRFERIGSATVDPGSCRFDDNGEQERVARERLVAELQAWEALDNAKGGCDRPIAFLRLLLARGRLCHARPRPKPFRFAPRQCEYESALRVALRGNDYCEGFYWEQNGRIELGAWGLDGNRSVIDCSRKRPECLTYFGIRIDVIAYARDEERYYQGASVLGLHVDDSGYGHLLLDQEVTEDADLSRADRISQIMRP